MNTDSPLPIRSENRFRKSCFDWRSARPERSRRRKTAAPANVSKRGVGHGYVQERALYSNPLEREAGPIDLQDEKPSVAAIED